MVAGVWEMLAGIALKGEGTRGKFVEGERKTDGLDEIPCGDAPVFFDLAEIPTDLGESLPNLRASPSEMFRDLMNLVKRPTTMRGSQMTAAVVRRTWRKVPLTCARC